MPEVFQQIYDELARAPLWAQIGIGFFVFTFLVMLVGPGFSHRRYRRQFDTIVRELGGRPSPKRGWPVSVPLTIDGRAYEIQHDFRGGKSHMSYRGPRGYLLITSVPLASKRWTMHQVDFHRMASRMTWLGSGTIPTGDGDFDARVAVIQDGLKVREDWLDGPTRSAVARFFDETTLPGMVWVREGQLQYLMDDSWKNADGAAIRALIAQQTTLAAALDRTADRA